MPSVEEMIKEHSLQDDYRFGELGNKLDNFHSSIKEDLTEIKIQVKATNGRVSKLEEWKNRALGAITVTVIILVPLILNLLKK